MRKIEYEIVYDETPGGIEYVSIRELTMDGNFVKDVKEIGMYFDDGIIHNLDYYLKNMIRIDEND